MKRLRIDKVMSILRSKGFATVDELSSVLGVSKITVRRYLAYLERENLIERQRGGAVLKTPQYDIPFFSKLEMNKEAKIKIGKKAVEFIENGETIFTTGGTTVYYTLQAIDQANISEITIITNSITSAWAVINLRRTVHLIHTGGIVRIGSFECIGSSVYEFVSKVHVNLLIIGVDSVNLEEGVSFSNYDESLIARKVAENSERILVVADSSKLGTKAPYTVIGWDRIDYLIIDKTPASESIGSKVGKARIITV